MAKVMVTLNGRHYAVGCEDGQEDHLKRLAAHVDRHMGELVDQVGQVGEVRLLLMSSLMVADELSDALARLDNVKAEVASLEAERDNLGEDIAKMEDKASRLMAEAAKKIEQLSGQNTTH